MFHENCVEIKYSVLLLMRTWVKNVEGMLDRSRFFNLGSHAGIIDDERMWWWQRALANTWHWPSNRIKKPWRILCYCRGDGIWKIHMLCVHKWEEVQLCSFIFHPPAYSAHLTNFEFLKYTHSSSLRYFLKWLFCGVIFRRENAETVSYSWKASPLCTPDWEKP